MFERVRARRIGNLRTAALVSAAHLCHRCCNTEPVIKISIDGSGKNCPFPVYDTSSCAAEMALRASLTESCDLSFELNVEAGNQGTETFHL